MPFRRPPKLFAEQSDELHPKVSIVCDVKSLREPNTVIFINKRKLVFCGPAAGKAYFHGQTGWVRIFQRVGKQLSRYETERRCNGERHDLLGRAAD